MRLPLSSEGVKRDRRAAPIRLGAKPAQKLLQQQCTCDADAECGDGTPLVIHGQGAGELGCDMDCYMKADNDCSILSTYVKSLDITGYGANCP